jgi:WD40 repeat protein
MLQCAGDVNSVVVNSDGSLITSDYGGESRIWHEIGGTFASVTQTNHPVTPNVYYSQTNFDQSLLAFGGGWAGLDQKTENRGAAVLWDVEDDSLFCPPLLHFDSVRRLSFDSSGKNLLTASRGNTARLYSIQRNDLSVNDAKRIASLYSQLEQLADKKVTNMPSSKLVSEYAELSKAYPQWFVCDSDDIQNWEDHLLGFEAIKLDGSEPGQQ